MINNSRVYGNTTAQSSSFFWCSCGCVFVCFFRDMRYILWYRLMLRQLQPPLSTIYVVRSTTTAQSLFIIHYSLFISHYSSKPVNHYPAARWTCKEQFKSGDRGHYDKNRDDDAPSSQAHPRISHRPFLPTVNLTFLLLVKLWCRS